MQAKKGVYFMPSGLSALRSLFEFTTAGRKGRVDRERAIIVDVSVLGRGGIFDAVDMAAFFRPRGYQAKR
jgi:hypothetical protein